MTSSGHYTFLPITFYREEIETWERCQSVRFIKTHQLICNMTYLGHFVTLTLGDPKSNVPIELLRSKSISIEAEEHIGVKMIPLTYVVQKLLKQNFFTKKT